MGTTVVGIDFAAARSAQFPHIPASPPSAGVPAMPKATQIVLAHENRPGLLAQIAQVLGDAKVNILAFLTTTSASEGLTRLIVDNPDSAKKALARTALRFREEDVLHIELPNEPGALAKFAAKLADKNINITLGYAASERGSKKTSVVLAVSDLDKAMSIR